MIDKVDMLLGGFATPYGVIPGCVTAEKYENYATLPFVSFLVLG